jgi:hypothetical protein
MRTYLIAGTLLLCLFAGGWAYAYMAGPPWLSGFARSATQSVANAAGIHAFDQAPQDGGQPGEPKKETVAQLPEGYYLYVGARPAASAPKWVAVNPGGTIDWLKAGETAPPKVALAADTNVRMPPPAGQFEEYNYPFVKWKAKPMADAEGAIAQLSTTYERGPAGQPGVVKYRLTLFKAANGGAREVQMLDDKGFKLHQFVASDFHQIPGSELMESRDEFQCDEEAYRQSRDYSIK